jgi:amidase
VADAAAVLSALIGVDPRDDSTANSQGKSHPDYTQFLNAEELKGSRIGIARASFGFHREVERRGEEALKRIEALGATLVDNTDLETRREFGRESYQVLLYEFKADLNAYLKELGPEAPVKTLEEIIEFNEKNRDREMPFFGQDVFISSQEKGPLSSKEYVEALAKCRRLSRQEGIDKVMDENNLDAIIAPTGGPAWVTDLINGDHFSGGSSTPAAVSGYPNITVPMGFVRGLPVGLSFFGRAWSEPKLIALAYSFEQGTKVRRAPEFIPALDLS